MNLQLVTEPGSSAVVRVGGGSRNVNGRRLLNSANLKSFALPDHCKILEFPFPC
jgi:hypothetical protein